MKPFSWLYGHVMRWSAHPHAPWYLGGLSFSEATFFPIPPDVLLGPMTLARPDQWFRLATITTVASVVGGLVGWLIGLFGIELVMPLIRDAGYLPAYEKAQSWFLDWGFWAILLAGFSPIPFKIFTIAAGALALNLPVFLVASLLGRGGRFYLVAWLVSRGGPAIEARIRDQMDLIGWALVAACVAGLAAWALIR